MWICFRSRYLLDSQCPEDLSSLDLRTVVSNLSDTRDWFCRQFSHGLGRGGDGVRTILIRNLPPRSLTCAVHKVHSSRGN